MFVQPSPEEAGRGQLVSLVRGEAHLTESVRKKGKPWGRHMSFLTRMALKANFLNWNNGTKCQTAHPHSLSLSLELSTHILPWVILFHAVSFCGLASLEMDLPVLCIRGICLSDVGFLKPCQQTGLKSARSLWKSPRGLVGEWERKPKRKERRCEERKGKKAIRTGMIWC